MKARLLVVFALILGMALVLTWAVAAQGPDDGTPRREGGPYVPIGPPGDGPPRFRTELEAPLPPQPGRGQRPLPLVASELGALGQAEMLGAGPLGVGGGPFDVEYFFDDMESGPAQWTATGLWHIVDAGSNYPNAYNDAASWWYGQEATGNYDTGSTPNSGCIQTGPVSILAGSEPVYLRFWSWEYTEADWSLTYDTRKVYTSTNGTDWSVIWQSDPPNDLAQWYEVLIDLTHLRGSDVYLRFEFDTVDGSHNGYRGWYVDDVAVGYDYVQLFPGGQTGYGVPGGSAWYPWWLPGEMWVQNNTGTTTAFTITATGVWTPTFPNVTPDLNPGDKWWLSGQVDIPTAADLGTYDDATLLVTSQVSPTLYTNIQVVRTWAGWVHHVDHQIIDDGSGDSQGDGDGRIDPGETIEMVVTLKNDLDGTAYGVSASMWDWVGLWWDDSWNSYGDIAAGATADSPDRYRFHVPSWVLPGTVIDFDLFADARGGGWFETFTETVSTAVRLTPPAQVEGGDPGETVVYNLTVENYTGFGGSFDLSAAGNSWPTDVSPTSTGPLADGATKQVTVTVDIPAGASAGDSDVVNVQASGVGTLTFADTAVITTAVLCPHRHVWTGSQSGAWSSWDDYSHSGERFALVDITATTYAPGDFRVEGWDGSSWTTLYSDHQVGTRRVGLFYAPAVYQEIEIYIDDDSTGMGWAYDYRFETCWDLVQLTPAADARAGLPGATVTRTFRLQNNTGIATPFTLTLSGASWSSVVTPTRTTTVPDGSSTDVTVTVDVPGTATAGDADAATLRASSVASPTLAGAAALNTTAISTGWYQAYTEDYPTTPSADTEAYLDSIHSFDEWRLTDDRYWEDDAAVSAFYRDRVPYAWTQRYDNHYGIEVEEVEFGARDVAGTVVIPATRVADHGEATDEIYDYDPAIAVDPVGGNIGLAWVRQDRSSGSGPWRWNVYYAVYDEDGNVVQPPTALTANTDDTVQDYSPAVEAYRDGSFAVAWEHYVSTSDVDSVYYAVLDSSGELVKPPADLTPGNTAGWGDFDPRLAQLLDGNMMAVWLSGFSFMGQRDATYAILSPAGTVVQGETALTNYAQTTGFGSAWEPDAVALSGGNTVVAWTRFDWSTGGSVIEYAVLGPTYSTVVSPTVLADTLSNSNQSVSLTEDADGRAVLTWDGGSERIFYALVDGDGDVIVEPVVYRQARNNLLDVNSKGYGNGGMEARPLVKVYLPLVLKNY